MVNFDWVSNEVDIAHILEDTAIKNDHAFPRTSDAVGYDRAILTSILKPKTSRIFRDD